MELLPSFGSESRILEMIEHMPEAVLFFDSNGRVRHANARGRDLLEANGNPLTLLAVLGREAEAALSRRGGRDVAPLQFRSNLKDLETGERVNLIQLRGPDGTLLFSGNVPGPLVEGYAFIYPAAFHWSSAALFILCPGTRRLIDASERASGLTGYTHAELLELDFDSLVSPELVRETLEKLSLASLDRIVQVRTCLVRKDGLRVSVDATLRAVPFDGRKAVVAEIRDVTDRNRQEAELRKRNGELLALNFISSITSSTLDLDEVLARSIDKTCEATGLPIGCIFLKREDQLVPLAHSGNCEDYVRITGPLKSGECAEGRAMLHRAPEVVEDLLHYPHLKCEMHLQTGIRSLVAVPIVYRDEVIGVLDLASREARSFTREELPFYQSIANTIGSAINTASYVHQLDSHKAELSRLVEELRRNNEKLRLTYEVQTQITRSINLDETLDAIIRNAPSIMGLANCIIFTAEGEGIVELKASGHLEKKYGKLRFMAEELVATKEAMLEGKPIVVEDTTQYQKISRRMVQLLEARTCIILPLAARGKVIGVMWLYDTREPRKYAEEDVARAIILSSQVAIAIDNAMLFSELSRANHELEISYERLKSLDRMKMEFFTVISHELRTPLTTIKGYAELMKDGTLGPVNDEQRDRLSRIDAGVDRLTRIVESLSDLSGVASRQYAGEKIPVSLNELIDEVVRGVIFLAETKGVAISVDVPVKLPVINADRNRLQQVLLNLLNNAIKYTPGGGKIEVSARDQGDHLLLAVHDTGIGIPKEDLENIFSGFYHAGYKLSYEYKGVGLGLAISKQIIESHGGKIWAESEPGKGSTFYFTLPKPAL